MYPSNQTSVITKNIQTHSQQNSSTLKNNNINFSIPISTNSVEPEDQFNHDLPSPSYSLSSSSSSSLSSVLSENLYSLSTMAIRENKTTETIFKNYLPEFYSSHLPSVKSCDIVPCLYEYGKEKRRPTPVPIENKDDAYWERRRRNNESAKRSRETRRRKEIQTTQRIIFLEQENVKLQTEVNFLREELSRLRENELFQYLIKKRSYDFFEGTFKT